ncbi:MAG: hypothetical protein ACYTHJ_23065 [Planctomycetota bacterium]
MASAQSEKPGASLTGTSSTTEEEGQEAVKIESLELAPLDDAAATALRVSMPMLASVNYQERQQASEDIKAIGAKAFKPLRDAYISNDDLELRMRIEQIVEWAFHEHRVYSRKAFLGVSLNTYEPGMAPPGLPVDPADRVLYIRTVIEDTAAFRVGLREFDVVLTLNGEPLDGNNQPDAAKFNGSQALVNDFSRRIASNRPGDTISVEVARLVAGEVEIEVLDIELGFLPEHMRQRSNVAAINQAMVESRAAFAAWWDFHFIQAEAELLKKRE